MSYSSLHNHSSYSNPSVLFVDSISSVELIVERAQLLGLHGVALTDHEMISGHIEMYRLQQKYPDIKLILGNEIYCMTEQQHNDRLNGEGNTPYYHLILLALDLIGWRQLCKLSTYAWLNSFYNRGLRRITTKEYIREVVTEDPGHIICCSACMGGEVAKLLMDNKTRAAELVVREFQDIFGIENFYMEIQPNERNTHQWESNKRVIELARKLKVPLIATTDSHMLDKNERVAHAAAKNSKASDDAEGEDFYATAYMMDEDELRYYLKNNLTDKQIDLVFKYTNEIADRVIGYDGILHAQMVPEIPEEYIPEFNIKHIFNKYYNKYLYFNLYAHKTEIHERYAFYEIEEGLIKKVLNNPKLAPNIEDYIARIDNEMKIMNAIDEHNGSKLIAYYSTCKFMCDEIWKLGSPIGIGRGSAGCWEINWLLGISQINPLEMGEYQKLLFSERHMNALRLDVMADVDTDSSPMFRQKIINRFREIWGEDRLLQVATFGTLKPKAAIKRACKGLGIDDEIAEAMSIMVPVERGEPRPLSVCLNPESTGKVSDLIVEVNKHEGLKEILLRLEGVIITMGTHAGGVCPFVPQYIDLMAMVKSPSGVAQTCFNLDDAEAVGATKYDILTTQAVELIRKCCELLIRDGYIEKKETFRESYESVIGVDNLIYEDSDLWNKVTRCPQCFQFETPIGKQILAKINPTSIEELTLASSLMRLLPPDAKEIPADRYLRYRESVENFRRDCRNGGLTEEEIKVLEDVCKVDGYMTIHQETLMTLSMHPKTAAYTYKEANALRKSVAKKSKKAQQDAYQTWIEWCDKNNTRREFANYIWNQMFAMQFGL